MATNAQNIALIQATLATLYAKIADTTRIDDRTIQYTAERIKVLENSLLKYERRQAIENNTGGGLSQCKATFVGEN